MITVEFKGYTLDDVKDNFWLLSIMYYKEMYAIAFELTNDRKMAEKAADRGFHSMSWCKIYNYDSLETIKKELGEHVEKQAKRLKKVA